LARRAGPTDVVVHEGPSKTPARSSGISGRRPVIVDGRRSVLGFGATRPESRDAFWTARVWASAWTAGPACGS